MIVALAIGEVVTLVILVTMFIIFLKFYKKNNSKNEIDEKDKQDNEIFESFLSEVEKFLFSKKLYPIIKPSDHDTIEVLHQNPGTTNLFVITDDLKIPSEKKGSIVWNRCMAEIEDEVDRLFKENSNELILEDMPNDNNI